MFKIDTENPVYVEMRNSVAKDVATAVFDLLKAEIAMSKDFPPMLDQGDIMRFFGCKRTLAVKIMQMDGFPRLKNVGNKCVPLHLLYKWIDDNAQLVEDSFPDFKLRAIK